MKTELISSRNEIDTFTRVLHLGLVVFGLLSWATGDLADDYKEVEGLGFFIHNWIGMSVTFFVVLRVTYGLLGPTHIRFSKWVPYKKNRLKLVSEDIAGLIQCRLPERQPHLGLAALVETLGLLVFSFMAVTGVVLSFAMEPGLKAQGMTHFIKELHEVGEVLLPLFFLIHGGAVVLHAITGRHLWRKMFFLKKMKKKECLE